MAFDAGKTVNTVVGGLVTIKVLEDGTKMLTSVSKPTKRRSERKKRSTGKISSRTLR